MLCISFVTKRSRARPRWESCQAWISKISVISEVFHVFGFLDFKVFKVFVVFVGFYVFLSVFVAGARERWRASFFLCF